MSEKTNDPREMFPRATEFPISHLNGDGGYHEESIAVREMTAQETALAHAAIWPVRQKNPSASLLTLAAESPREFFEFLGIALRIPSDKAARLSGSSFFRAIAAVMEANPAFFGLLLGPGAFAGSGTTPGSESGESSRQSPTSSAADTATPAPTPSAASLPSSRSTASSPATSA